MSILNNNRDTRTRWKSLKLFDGFDVEPTSIVWNGKVILFRQRFLRARQTIASAVIQARFLGKSHSKVSPEQVLNLGGHSGSSPEILEWMQRWAVEQEGMV